MEQKAATTAQECGPQKTFKSKAVAYVAMMSALGTILAVISMILVPFGPNVALDLSHVGTYLVALPGGPILGLIAGALVGVIPGFRFANAALIPGKMMTGVTVGLIAFLFKKIPKYKENKALQIISIPIAGIVGYIPEAIFTMWDLSLVMAFPGADAVILTIMIKAWIEIIVISCLMTLILNIPAIAQGIKGLIGEDAKLSAKEYLVSGIVIGLGVAMLMGIFVNTGFMNISDYGLDFKTPGLLLSVFFTWIIVTGVVVGVLVVVLLVKMKQKPCPPVA
jgi:hypothetical protein